MHVTVHELERSLNNRSAMMETKIKELTVRITEITNINNNVTMVKTKLENELKSVTADYDDIARELKLADDRANKASGDAAHFESLMREEHQRLVQIDGAKKALENEVITKSIYRAVIHLVEYKLLFRLK